MYAGIGFCALVALRGEKSVQDSTLPRPTNDMCTQVMLEISTWNYVS